MLHLQGADGEGGGLPAVAKRAGFCLRRLHALRSLNGHRHALEFWVPIPLSFALPCCPQACGCPSRRLRGCLGLRFAGCCDRCELCELAWVGRGCPGSGRVCTSWHCRLHLARRGQRGRDGAPRAALPTGEELGLASRWSVIRASSMLGDQKSSPRATVRPRQDRVNRCGPAVRRKPDPQLHLVLVPTVTSQPIPQLSLALQKQQANA